jgi:hypothetical protein
MAYSAAFYAAVTGLLFWLARQMKKKKGSLLVTACVMIAVLTAIGFIQGQGHLLDPSWWYMGL